MKVMHIGGQETVTITLANKFASEGHKVSIVSFEKPWKEAINQIDNSIQVYTLDGFKYSKKNVLQLKDILSSEKIDIAINQWGLPYIPAMVLEAAIKKGNLKTKKIAIYHNDPETNARIMDVNIALDFCKNPLMKFLLLLKKNIIKKITCWSMRYVYKHSDQYQVLSPSYIEHFKKFTGIKSPKNLVVQANPTTISSNNFSYNSTNKNKEIIYCGRIDYNQKRVYRIIDVWSLLEAEFPEWKLTIIGDGESRSDIEKKVQALNLQNVYFEGFQKPIEYYKRASILVLTSEYEGFPLVIAESMSFGVIPCVYGSFSAVHDIIENNKNGIIVEKDENGNFSAYKTAESIKQIMNDEKKRGDMARTAIESSKNYSLDMIYGQWLNNILNINT
jgi:glycosyltransferase involved in cell wall biosynthesis